MTAPAWTPSHGGESGDADAITKPLGRFDQMVVAHALGGGRVRPCGGRSQAKPPSESFVIASSCDLILRQPSVAGVSIKSTIPHRIDRRPKSILKVGQPGLQRC